MSSSQMMLHTGSRYSSTTLNDLLPSNDSGRVTVTREVGRSPAFITLCVDMQDQQMPSTLGLSNGLFSTHISNHDAAFDELAELFERALGGERNAAIPVLLFTTSGDDYTFRGLLAPGLPDRSLSDVFRPTAGGRVRLVFTLFDVESIDPRWLIDRVNGYGVSACTPDVWQQWVDAGVYASMRASTAEPPPQAAAATSPGWLRLHWKKLGGLVGLIGLLSGVLGLVTGALDVAALFPPFPKAKPDEVLVIVTDFTGESVDTRIYGALSERLAGGGYSDVRLERLHEAPETPEDAQAIGNKFRATLVIWGVADAYGIAPRYEVTRSTELIEARPDFGETRLEEPDSFSLYVVEGVPAEFEYLMLLTLGQLEYFSGEYLPASELFTQALSTVEDTARADALVFSSAYFYRGTSYYMLDERDKALEDYTRVLDLDDEHISAYYNRGVVYGESGQYEQAVADFARALELDPRFADAYYSLGITYTRWGQYEQAVDSYTRALDLDPADVNAYYNRGNAYRDLAEYERAAADYSAAIDIDSEYFIAYVNRGNVYTQLGNYEQALSDYTEALRLNADDVAAYFNRGNTYSLQGDYEQAVTDYTRAIELDPAHFDAYANRGYAYAELGETALAVADFERVLTIAPPDNDAYTFAIVSLSLLRE